MKIPTLFLVAVLAVPAACAATTPNAAAQEMPIKLGVMTPEGFDDPAHVYFFRYQALLRRNGLDGLDADAWKALEPAEREKKVGAGENWLKEKFSVMMGAPYLSATDGALLTAVWGKDVAEAAAGVGKALQLGDPEQIRAAREKVQGLVKSVGGARLDWSAIFDGAAPGAVVAPNLPDPLALKKPSAFLASLSSKEVREPLASRATFVAFLQKKNVPADAFPALVAMYDVLSRAQEPEKSETAHLLPTVVRFLNDGKQIRDEELPGTRALAFAVPGDYDQPDHVGITAAARNSDPVEIGDILAHEFQHVYDQYAGRYYTLDSELRGFKTNVLFMEIMKKDPQLSKKLSQLMNSDDDATRSFFRDDADVDAKYAESPQAFADVVAFGHGYDGYDQGVFQGRLTLREATDPQIGLQRQVAAENRMAKDYRANADALEATLAALKAKPSSQANDEAIEKISRDLVGSQGVSVMMGQSATKDTLRLNRMLREVQWMDRRAAASGKPPAAYDLSLPVSPDYVVPGN